MKPSVAAGSCDHTTALLRGEARRCLSLSTCTRTEEWKERGPPAPSLPPLPRCLQGHIYRRLFPSRGTRANLAGCHAHRSCAHPFLLPFVVGIKQQKKALRYPRSLVSHCSASVGIAFSVCVLSPPHLFCLSVPLRCPIPGCARVCVRLSSLLSCASVCPCPHKVRFGQVPVRAVLHWRPFSLCHCPGGTTSSFLGFALVVPSSPPHPLNYNFSLSLSACRFVVRLLSLSLSLSFPRGSRRILCGGWPALVSLSFPSLVFFFFKLACHQTDSALTTRKEAAALVSVPLSVSLSLCVSVSVCVRRYSASIHTYTAAFASHVISCQRGSHQLPRAFDAVVHGEGSEGGHSK